MNTGMKYKGAVVGMAAGIFIMSSGMAYAGSVTVPNTFSSGTPAVAAEVNANFSAVASEVNDNDGRITTNAGAIATNTSDIAALDARIAALEGSGGLTVASINGTYKIFSLDNGTGYHEQDDGTGIYRASDDDVVTEQASMTFDGAGNFTGVIDNGAELTRVTDQDGNPTYSMMDSTGVILGGTYSVSGSEVTLYFTSPEVSTETAYATADGSVIIMHQIAAESGTGWEFYNTVIRVGVKLAQ